MSRIEAEQVRAHADAIAESMDPPLRGQVKRLLYQTARQLESGAELYRLIDEAEPTSEKKAVALIELRRIHASTY